MKQSKLIKNLDYSIMKLIEKGSLYKDLVIIGNKKSIKELFKPIKLLENKDLRLTHKSVGTYKDIPVYVKSYLKKSYIIDVGNYELQEESKKYDNFLKLYQAHITYPKSVVYIGEFT